MILGIAGSVIAKEGRLPDVSGLASGAFKVGFWKLNMFLCVLLFLLFFVCIFFPLVKDVYI